MSEAASPPLPPRAVWIVQEAERILLRPLKEPTARLHVVVRRSGIGLGSLRHAFHRVHGVSPARYLRDRRLDLVREALEAAPDRPSAVKQAAMEHGFRHLGHFARAYRQRFAELPSETLARAASRAAGCRPSPLAAPSQRGSPAEERAAR